MFRVYVALHGKYPLRTDKKEEEEEGGRGRRGSGGGGILEPERIGLIFC